MEKDETTRSGSAEPAAVVASEVSAVVFVVFIRVVLVGRVYVVRIVVARAVRA